MVTTLRTRLSRAGARWQRCFSLRLGARSVVDLAGRSQARGLPSSRCPGMRGHTWSRSARLAGRSQARGLSSSRCPGVRGHTGSRSAQPCQRTPAQPSAAQRTPAHPSAPQRTPAHPSAAHSGASNCGFQDDRRGRGQTRRNSHADADLAGLGPTPRCVRCAAAALRHGRRSLRHTLEQGLGEAFATEVRLAWTQVYGVIADTMQQAGRVSEPA